MELGNKCSCFDGLAIPRNNNFLICKILFLICFFYHSLMMVYEILEGKVFKIKMDIFCKKSSHPSFYTVV